MRDKPVALELAAFLDSEEARALLVARADVSRIAELFFEACFDGLGKAPWLLDAEDVRSLLARDLPARLQRGDRLAPFTPAVLAALFAHLNGTRFVPHAFEMHSALEQGIGDFQAAVAKGELAGRASKTSPPFVHGAPKLGRNDPCFCGSGKKFKKCHG